jgi:hypothetical protein
VPGDDLCDLVFFDSFPDEQGRSAYQQEQANTGCYRATAPPSSLPSRLDYVLQVHTCLRSGLSQTVHEQPVPAFQVIFARFFTPLLPLQTELTEKLPLVLPPYEKEQLLHFGTGTGIGSVLLQQITQGRSRCRPVSHVFY